MTNADNPTTKSGPDAKAPYEPKGGEDESSASHDGGDDHLHEDQKPTTK